MRVSRHSSKSTTSRCRKVDQPSSESLLHTPSVFSTAILSAPDAYVGIIKSIVYGAMIGMVGCLRGMQTKIGAGAVGLSTTRAVVTAIVLLVMLEGLFSVILYFLEI